MRLTARIKKQVFRVRLIVDVCLTTRLYGMGIHVGVGVRYVDTSIPIYIGEIMHKGTHNLSYGSA